MTTLTEFLTARLGEEEQTARNASMGPVGGPRDVWVYDREGFAVRVTHGRWNVATRSDNPADGREIHMSDAHGEHIVRHQPVRVLREVAAKRRVMERHSRYDGTALYDYCAGCPTGDETGYPDTELKDCPELQDLAFIWNEHEDWNQEWCPHVEGRHEEDVTEVPPARGCYTNACNRCGQGDGWHYRKDRVT